MPKQSKYLHGIQQRFFIIPATMSSQQSNLEQPFRVSREMFAPTDLSFANPRCSSNSGILIVASNLCCLQRRLLQCRLQNTNGRIKSLKNTTDHRKITKGSLTNTNNCGVGHKTIRSKFKLTNASANLCSTQPSAYLCARRSPLYTQLWSIVHKISSELNYAN